MYISAKMHLIVHLEGVHFTTCNLYLDNIDLKNNYKRTWALGSDPNLKLASATSEVSNICTWVLHS